MDGLPFTLRQLEVFEHVAETKSFRKASEELGISQAAVSNQLKALERQLGFRLLVRDPGKRPRLTPEGAAFLADLGKFREASAELASHRQRIPKESSTEVVRIDVLIGTYLFKDFVRPRLDGFFERHPEIELNVTSPAMTEEPRLAVGRGDFDFAMFSEAVSVPLEAGQRELARVRCGVYGHAWLLGDGDGPLPAELVSELPFLLPPAGSYHEGLILRLLAERGVKPKRVAGRTGFFDVMSETIERGSSVCVTLESLLVPKEHRQSVLLFPLEDWHVVLYRNPGRRIPEMDSAEEFLVSSVLENPKFPRI
jgi:DNA-binding transcriptional LysR family regulator